MSDLAKLSIGGPLARLTLDRPDARNAMSIPLLHALHHRLDELEKHDKATVLLITGAGRAFCAGMDLKAVLDEPDAPGELLGSLARLTLRIRALPMVVVARVNGAAIGGGCGLTCVCDIAVTHADSKMGFPEVDLGVCPAVVAPWVVKKIGPGRARSVLLRGGLMSGRDAGQVGLVDVVTDSLDTLDEATERLLEHLVKSGPNAMRATKGLLNELDGSLDASVVERGAALSTQVVTSDEARASLRERFGKR